MQIAEDQKHADPIWQDRFYHEWSAPSQSAPAIVGQIADEWIQNAIP